MVTNKVVRERTGQDILETIIRERQLSSVQFSKAICIAQLSGMSHCAPAARKPVRFKFTPETRVGDVLVA